MEPLIYNCRKAKRLNFREILNDPLKDTKKQKRPVREIFDKIVLIDRRPTDSTVHM